MNFAKVLSVFLMELTVQHIRNIAGVGRRNHQFQTVSTSLDLLQAEL